MKMDREYIDNLFGLNAHNAQKLLLMLERIHAIDYAKMTNCLEHIILMQTDERNYCDQLMELGHGDPSPLSEVPDKWTPADAAVPDNDRVVQARTLNGLIFTYWRDDAWWLAGTHEEFTNEAGAPSAWRELTEAVA